MVGPVRIALAQERDVPEIRRLLAHAESPFDVEAELARRYARLWVARADETVVGFLLAWQVADEVELLDIVVADAYRRRGAGRALMQHLREFAVESRVRKVVLEVRASNAPAIALYTSFEFAQVGERAAYYANGETALVMQLELWY